MKIGNQTSVNNMMSRYFDNANAMRAMNVRQMASGYKINSAKDNASGLAMAKKLYSQIAGTGVATENAQDAVSMVQVADGALAKVGEMAGRMNELALKASNETLGETDRAALQTEYDGLAKEIDRVGQSTNFNGIRLFDSSTYTMQVGPGKGDTVDLKFGEISAAALGIAKADLSTAKGASEAVKATKTTIGDLAKQRGDLGAAEKGLQYTLKSLGKSEESLTSSLSQLMDTDYGTASMNNALSGTLSQTSMAMMKNSQYLMQYNVLSLLMR